MELTVERRGIRLNARVEGPASAPPVLLLHSLGVTHRLWDPQIRRLTESYRVVRYDTRGHGASSAPAGDYSVEDLGGDALDILDHLEIDESHVCGISLGGLTALWLGVHAPQRVRSLVVANSAARIGSVESWSDRITLVRERGMRGVADAAAPRWLSEPFRAAHPEVERWLRGMVEACSPEGYIGCCAALRDTNLRTALSSIARPVLAIAGSGDVTTPPSNLAEVARGIAGAQMAALNAAHLSNVECPDAFNALVLRFLDKSPPTS